MLLLQQLWMTDDTASTVKESNQWKSLPGAHDSIKSIGARPGSPPRTSPNALFMALFLLATKLLCPSLLVTL